jgi:ParB-like chromosome segregation protein Spo0J
MCGGFDGSSWGRAFFAGSTASWEPVMANLTITYRKPADLKSRPTSPRTHSKKQIEQIAASICEFGFTNPVLVDEDNRIIAGHGRVKAAKLIGMTEVPTVRLTDMTEAQLRAYVIADNRLAENAGWDRELLALELQSLSELNLEIDVTLTGFDLPEIDILLDELSAQGIDENEPGSADMVPDLADSPAVTRPDDALMTTNAGLVIRSWALSRRYTDASDTK